MSNNFMGLTMLVTLNSPPGAQLRGVVSGIEPGKSLTLRNVTCPHNNKYVPEFTIPVHEIVELVESTNENTPHPAAPLQASKNPLRATPVSAASPFEDPAILSMGKRPVPEDSRSAVPSQFSASSMRRGDSSRTATGREGNAQMTSAGPETLVEPIQEMRMNGDNMGDIAEGLIVDELEVEEEELVVSEAIAVKGGKTRTRRRKGRKNAEDLEQDPAAKPAKETTRSKGWRQTPLLEPNPSFQPFSTLKRKNGRRGGGKMEENGWATEDATDVQDMGDFDFVGGLAKFDKSTVFNQIQAEDSVADEDRLVAHNRLPKAKPGTAGGKNLHYTENVLDGTQNGTPKLKADAWKSEAGESELEEREERASQRGSGSGRVSRRADSKLALNRRSTSRKGSTNIGGQPVRAMSIPTTSSNPSFLLIPSGRPCETISALQMLNLENIADNDLGLTEDMMTENAGRGIAEVTMSALESKRPLVQSKKVAIRNVIVFAGNNKSGLRAISAARHIRNHGINVVICVLGLERESELLAGLRRQIKVFRSFGGKIISKNELLEYVKTLDAPIELIIDGLLGLTISFEELRRGDQAAAYELIEWANRSKAPVLAIDIPTGIDPTSGKVSIIDGRRLYIHARFVVAMGAPKKGLLDAMALGEGVPNEDGNGEWLLYVADLGLGSAVWKKAGTKIRRGVEFEGSWVLEMKFQGTA